MAVDDRVCTASCYRTSVNGGTYNKLAEINQVKEKLVVCVNWNRGVIARNKVTLNLSWKPSIDYNPAQG